MAKMAIATPQGARALRICGFDSFREVVVLESERRLQMFAPLFSIFFITHTGARRG